MLRFFRRHPWLIAVLMLALATLACDDGWPTLAYVKAVQADPQRPGTAYALIANVRDMAASASANASSSGFTEVVYETRDAGQTWQPSEYRFPNDAPPPASLAISMQAEALWIAQDDVWRFPRATFRSIFHAEAYGYLYQLPYGQVSNSLGDRALYVAMGTEGVLVGRFDDEDTVKRGAWHQLRWGLGASGIRELNPIKLTFTNPQQIGAVILAALLFPPLVMIHSYVLRRVWGYAVRDEDAGHWALYVSLGLALAAGLSIAIWLVDVNLDFYPMVGVMTVVTVIAGLVTAFRLTHARPPAVRRWVLAATALASLIVPSGVAALWFLWPPILMLVWGYYIYRRLYADRLSIYLDKIAYPRPRWLLDRLTLQTIAAGVLCAMAMLVVAWLGLVLPVRSSADTWLALIATVLLAVIGIVAAVRAHANALLMRLLTAHPHPAPSPAPTSSVPLPLGWSVHVNAVALWLLGTAIFSGVVFFAQSSVYSWFQTLLR
jgi:hypothetical protein